MAKVIIFLVDNHDLISFLWGNDIKVIVTVDNDDDDADDSVDESNLDPEPAQCNVTNANMPHTQTSSHSTNIGYLWYAWEI